MNNIYHFPEIKSSIWNMMPCMISLSYADQIIIIVVKALLSGQDP